MILKISLLVKTLFLIIDEQKEYLIRPYPLAINVMKNVTIILTAIMRLVTYFSCNVKNVKLNLMVVAVLIVKKFILYQLMIKETLEKGKETVIKFLKRGGLPTRFNNDVKQV